jgi:CDP-glycerol glycerophosphotransferase (TagB/SpsB family)
VPRLARASVVVCAEQTSLWLPTLLPMRARFVKMPHGAGSLMKRDDRRRRAAWRTCVPAAREAAALAAVGVDPATIAVTGYAKAEFTHHTPPAALFAESRPIVLYNPHWQQHRSSWWRWGPEVVRRIVAADRYNLIFAPHQRLVERADDVAPLCEELAASPNVHCDFTSFATVDGSYTAAADVYLGDTSSQVVEFLIRPRPAVFVDAQGTDWQANPAYDMWRTGEVIADPDPLLAALDRAAAEHPRYIEAQHALATDLLGPLDGCSAARAATVILAALDGD